jgi:hypothetical protein
VTPEEGSSAKATAATRIPQASQKADRLQRAICHTRRFLRLNISIGRINIPDMARARHPGPTESVRFLKDARSDAFHNADTYKFKDSPTCRSPQHLFTPASTNDLHTAPILLAWYDYVGVYKFKPGKRMVLVRERGPKTLSAS